MPLKYFFHIIQNQLKVVIFVRLSRFNLLLVLLKTVNKHCISSILVKLKENTDNTKALQFFFPSLQLHILFNIWFSRPYTLLNKFKSWENVVPFLHSTLILYSWRHLFNALSNKILEHFLYAATPLSFYLILLITIY